MGFYIFALMIQAFEWKIEKKEKMEECIYRKSWYFHSKNVDSLTAWLGGKRKTGFSWTPTSLAVSESRIFEWKYKLLRYVKSPWVLRKTALKFTKGSKRENSISYYFLLFWFNQNSISVLKTLLSCLSEKTLWKVDSESLYSNQGCMKSRYVHFWGP